MNLKKYISKHFIMRLCLLFLLVSGAAVFDIYHVANQKLADNVRKNPASNNTENSHLFLCNQLPTYNLKTAGNDFTVRFRLSYSQDKFLLKHYNLRTFQMMKAETVHSFFPSVCSFHSLPFNRVLYASPDDTPPLS
ncbi:hypothetical protein [Aquipluma nitroreducens]|uniref:hypothetical protein n=1 Tax=Aquipluma nitroreducens TaxID=2010828 RepID=UPI00296E3836|nr:hypothetical protein [Aquipluma nitroreducens]